GPRGPRGGLFCAAGAGAMRRILVENARRKRRLRHGGGLQRLPLDRLDLAEEASSDEVLALDQALEELTREAPDAAAVVNLRYFAGLTAEQAADALGLSLRTANRHWAYARARLYRRLRAARPDS